MPGSEEASTMDLKETELTLGLPGANIFRRDSGEKSGVKRGFLHTLDSSQDVNEQVDHSDTASKAQLVGWPPVRTSRKNSIKNCKYVKVAVDGAPYLRKVDLQLYNNYQHLLKAFENMFSCFTIRNFFNDGKLMDPLNGSEYVPTYEDKDGDWMMVGDTPWKMFVESCQRIRLRKGSEAIGLEPRPPSKVD